MAWLVRFGSLIVFDVYWTLFDVCPVPTYTPFPRSLQPSMAQLNCPMFLLLPPCIYTCCDHSMVLIIILSAFKSQNAISI
ncbi:hypothetical protein V8C42DRAFT_226604 [Trichoderma barbatum]